MVSPFFYTDMRRKNGFTVAIPTNKECGETDGTKEQLVG